MHQAAPVILWTLASLAWPPGCGPSKGSRQPKHLKTRPPWSACALWTALRCFFPISWSAHLHFLPGQPRVSNQNHTGVLAALAHSATFDNVCSRWPEQHRGVLHTSLGVCRVLAKFLASKQYGQIYHNRFVECQNGFLGWKSWAANPFLPHKVTNCNMSSTKWWNWTKITEITVENPARWILVICNRRALYTLVM